MEIQIRGWVINRRTHLEGGISALGKKRYASNIAHTSFDFHLPVLPSVENACIKYYLTQVRWLIYMGGSWFSDAENGIP